MCGGFVDWAYHLILPCTTLAIVVAGTYVRFVRAEVMETLTMDFVRTARAKGAPERTVIRSHVLRNAMLPVVTMVGMDIGLLLGGSIFIEAVFGLPGLGSLAIRSIGTFDLPDAPGRRHLRRHRDHHLLARGRSPLRVDRPANPPHVSFAR